MRLAQFTANEGIGFLAIAIARKGRCDILIRFVFNKRESETMETNLCPQFPPLESVTRPTVDTAAAAFYLNRRPQTLRIYASRESGPLRPIRISGRLAWKTDDLRRLLGIPAYGHAGVTK